MKKHRMLLVLGGISSGKSEFAERSAGRFGRHVLYVATAAAGPRSDKEWRLKIDGHRRRRPETWNTVELNGHGIPDSLLTSTPSAILLDSLSLWVSRRYRQPLSRLKRETALFLDQLRSKAPLIVVSDEVGLGTVPLTAAGRKFIEALGRVNAQVADAADEVVLIVSGQPLRLKSLTPRRSHSRV